MAERLMVEPREGGTQPKHRLYALPPDAVEGQGMSASTRELHQTLIRMAKGAVMAYEKWLQEHLNP